LHFARKHKLELHVLSVGRIGLDHVAFHWKLEIEGSDHTIYFTVTVGMQGEGVDREWRDR